MSEFERERRAQIAAAAEKEERDMMVKAQIQKVLDVEPKSTPSKDMVNKVSHYNHGIEVIDALESWDLNFSRSNVIKYLVRAGRKSKETELQDLLKSQYYLNREIERLRQK